MARYEHLPIYKASFALLMHVETLVHGFSRYHKYTHGTDMRNTAREVVKLVVRANNREDKVPVLAELRERLEELKLLARIVKELRALPNLKAYERLADLIVDVSRQNEGWMRSLARRGSGPNPRAHPARSR